MVGGLFSLPARVPAQLEGFPLGLQGQYPRKMLVSLGPGSRLLLAHWIMGPLLPGLAKSTGDNERLANLCSCPHSGHVCAYHDRDWQTEQESRVHGQGGR